MRLVDQGRRGECSATVSRGTFLFRAIAEVQGFRLTVRRLSTNRGLLAEQVTGAYSRLGHRALAFERQSAGNMATITCIHLLCLPRGMLGISMPRSLQERALRSFSRVARGGGSTKNTANPIRGATGEEETSFGLLSSPLSATLAGDGPQ